MEIGWFFFILGSIFGSFLNVCIYRIPRKESVVFTQSHCPQCAFPIKPYDNIPIISYILLFGKCRTCKCNIPFQYPLVELINGVIIWLLYLKFNLTFDFFLFSFLSMSLLVLSGIDILHQLLLNKIVIPLIIIGFISSFFRVGFSAHQALFGFLLAGGIFISIAKIYPGGMGGGDIKLMALCGSFIGWTGVILVIIISSFTGAVIGGAALLISGKDKKVRIPFGPFISFATLVNILWGKEIIQWYLKTFLFT